jgi:tetratricopeptide (TPR) repeat protein
MFRISYLKVLLTLVFLTVGFSAVQAQTAPVSGRVELKKADGSKVPVQGALVEAYRVDIKGAFPAAKTDKRGEFRFAGMPLGARIVLSISAPGTKPGFFPNVKAGDSGIVISVEEGDGKRWTEDEIREALAGAGSSGSDQPAQATEDEKKAKAEYDKKVAEVAAKNKDVENKNQIIQNALKEGNAAFDAKNFETAIVRYTEGINADPQYVGSVPVLAVNRTMALRARAVATYNEAIKSADASTKAQGVLKAKKDLSDAMDSLQQGWAVLKAANPSDDSNYAANKTRLLENAKDIAQIMVRMEQADADKIPTAKALLDEYGAAATEPAKKAEAKLLVADLYRIAGDSEKAIAAYKEVLAVSPDNVDALAGLGLSLVNQGYIANDKASLQEGANYLQKFVSAAPDTHRYKKDAVMLIDSLKAEQNVTPQKGAAGKKKN